VARGARGLGAACAAAGMARVIRAARALCALARLVALASVAAMTGMAALLLAALGAERSVADAHAGGRPDSESVAQSPLDILRGGAPEEGFARADAVRPFEFPRDHGPHPAFRHEWWYFTGHLQAADGEQFGFEVTFFRIALAPPRSAAGLIEGGGIEGASRWRARQIYVAHFAITDIGRRTFHSAQRFARDALGLAGAQAAPLRVWLGDWSVAAPGHAAAAPDRQAAVPAHAGAAPDHAAADVYAGNSGKSWILYAADSAYGLTLLLHPISPPVLNGDRGLSIKSNEPGAASYYYSIPRLGTHGKLVRGGRAIEVSGTTWLDREWGSGSLGPHQEGWDWFALQLADGSALMYYALRDRGGARDPHSAGTWVDPAGRAHPLSGADVRIDVLDHWESPRGGRYPSRWRVRVDSIGLDIVVTPALADQELHTTPRYWEGDVEVSGIQGGRPASGRGYVELVGYTP